MAFSTGTLPGQAADPVTEEALRRFSIGACMAFLILGPPNAALWLAAGDVAMGSLLLAASLPALLIRSALKSGAPPRRLSWAIAGAMLILISCGTWRSGGLGSLHTIWFLVLPLLGTYLFGPRGCLTLSVLSTAALASMWAWQASVAQPPIHAAEGWIPALNIAALCGFALAATLLTAHWRSTAEFERTLREQTEQGFARAVQNMDDAVLVIDPKGTVEHSNRAGTRLLDAIPGQAQGARAWLEASSGVPIPDGLRDGDSLELRHPIDGRHYELSNSAWAGRWVLTLHDVSHRVAMEEQLRRAGEEAHQASRAKSEFLANMSHEIRTPMNGILGMAEIALQDRPDPEMEDKLNTIRRCGQSMLSLLNDILDLSRIEAGHMELDHAEFNLRQVLDEVHETLGGTASLAGLEMRCSIGKDVPAGLLGDHHRLRQVLLNLVGNALKFTEEGSVHLNVEQLSRTDDQALVRFAVHDTGIGIHASEIATLFDKFTQGDAGADRRNRGTGLGLAISSELVDRMGGKIVVDSTPGKGSTFRFDLQLPITADEVADCESASALVGQRILIIDRDEVRGRGLARVVRRLGGRYETAPAIGEALARLRHAIDGGDEFHAVLLAHPTPGNATARVVQTIREDRVASTTPIIVVADECDKKATQLKIEGVLTRPVDQTALKSALLNLERPAGLAPAATPRDSAPPARILLVEDNPINQQLVLALLKRDGYTADVAENGHEAVEAAQKGIYGLILMDCQMPGMDGYEATRQIRELGAGAASVPIVALTANAMDGDRDRCLDAGMDDYLGKPLRSEDLRMVLERWSPKVRR